MDPVTLAVAALTISGVGGVLAQWRSRFNAKSIEQELDKALSEDTFGLTDTNGKTVTHRSSQATIRVLNKFSAQGLAQSELSFFCSIVFAALGFMIIVAGVGFAIMQPENTAQSALIPVIGGAVVEAVSALFFSVNIRAQKVVTSYFDKTREDRRLEEALTLAENIKDQHTASRLKSVLAMKFVGMDNLPALLEQVVQPNSPNNALSFTATTPNGEAHPVTVKPATLNSSKVADEEASPN